MLLRSRDISSVTKPSSGRWASGTDRVLRGRLGKLATRDRPLPGAPANVPETAGAADVSDAAAREGWSPYRLCPDPEQDAWVAAVIDWQRAA